MNKIAKWPVFRFFLNSKEVFSLIIKCILMIAVIPWGLLMLNAVIFDRLTGLTTYAVTIYAIFGWLCFTVLLGIFNSVYAIIRFAKRQRYIKNRRTAESADKE